MAYQLTNISVDLTRKVKYLHSIHIAENAATPAPAKVWYQDGGSGGPLVIDLRLVAGESKHIVFAKPLYFPNGLYVNVTTGTVRGSVDGV